MTLASGRISAVSTSLPADLPAPVDDGACDHLPGRRFGAVELRTTSGNTSRLDQLGGEGPAVVYVFPMIGRPGQVLPDGWDSIPGARGCTAEACAFRDHLSDLRAAGASTVCGLSCQAVDDLEEAVARLHLPFPVLSDPTMRLAEDPGLPTFEVGSRRLYRRATLIVVQGHIEHVFYPVFPVDQHPAEVVGWLSKNISAR